MHSQIAAIIKAIESNQSNSSLPPLPRLLFSEDVAAQLGLKIATLRHYTGNAEKFGHLLPKWFKLPGARRLAWLEDDVLAWIRKGQLATPPLERRRRGRPTRAEQLRREARV